MENLNNIGLDITKSEELAELLNDLLANYSVFYQNTRGYHWNIRGDKFFELHVKFEELYNDLFVKIDEVAERVLTLGHVSKHKFTDYLQHSEILESNEVSDGLKAIEEIHVDDVFDPVVESDLDLSKSYLAGTCHCSGFTTT